MNHIRIPEQHIIQVLAAEVLRLQSLGHTLEGVYRGLLALIKKSYQKHYNVSVHRPSANSKSWTTDGPPFLVVTPMETAEGDEMRSKFSGEHIPGSAVVVDLFWKERCETQKFAAPPLFL
eukprot:TRINITY_DN1596_c0_g1_i3.p2 TRINITY_DN1596_c0_g1~~TRINITY_DN1596_c0_g1_i3.p2  ORF type:complete len:120 (+),score=5.75 TRINITY_DN1596_c0_g1_i3:250-609(+)